MKCRWEFPFDCEDVIFDGPVEYYAECSQEDWEKIGLRESTIRITIEPTPGEPNARKQRGTMNVFLTGTCEATGKVASHVVRLLAQQLAFLYPKFKVHGYYEVCERIPETPEEEESIKEGVYMMTLRLITVPERQPFQPVSFETAKYSALIDQFHAANAAKSPVDQFIGHFKIIEDLYGPVKNETLAPYLKQSSALYELAKRTLKVADENGGRAPTKTEFDKLIDGFVRVRHECAHLRSRKNFGIGYADPRVKTEVEPSVEILTQLTRAAVQEA